MVIRSQLGIVKPLDCLSLYTSSVSPIPKSHFLALKDQNWCNAMYDEYNVLVKNGTWILIPRLIDANMVRSMWLFKHKFHADGTLSHYKARLVANGSTQQLGVDFDETFRPVAKPNTIRTVLSLVVSRYATKAHFTHNRFNSSLFIYTQGSQVAYLLIYVDDIILTASSPVLLQQIIDSLHKEFDMTDLGALKYFLGIFAVRHSILFRHHKDNFCLEKSTFGYCIFLGDNLLSWCAKRQHTVSRSNAEAKYRGVSNVVAETAWHRNLLCELHSPLLTTTLVYCDNAIHGDDDNVGGHIKSGAKSCWLDIVRETHALKTKGINLLDCMHVKLGNGDKTVFWEDIWIDGKTLKNRFPRIYSLESCKLITVGAKLAQPSLEYSFRRNPRGGVEQDQFNELSALVHDVSLIPMSDRWKWDLESSGDFSVASVRKIIDDKSLSDVDSKTRWIKYVPIKVNVHAWKVKTDSLPTRFNVSRRGIDIDSIMCAICDNGVETSRHLFFYCCMVRQIVRKITRWWDVPYVEVESYEDWYNWLVNLRISSMHKQMFEGIDVMRRLVDSLKRSHGIRFSSLFDNLEFVS
ncbi:RNA-directed DNA polymerase, eukaryota [Tanacetum coccineum]